MAKNSDLKNVFLSLIELAEAGDVRGTAFASRMSGPILGLMAHNVAKASKSAPASEVPADAPAVETSASVDIVASASAPAEAASVETPATARKSARVASASA